MSISPDKIIIKPSSKYIYIPVRELYQYKDLLYFLVWRDIKVRYKQTVLGVVWVILQPLISMIIFSIIFGRLAHLPSEGIPYPVFTYSALLSWQLFAYSLTQSSESLVSNEKLITKVYFPRILIPLTPIFSGLFDFLISIAVFSLIMLYYKITPSLDLIYLPFFILLAISTALGIGLWFTALNVRFRDVRYTIPFLTQAWLYLTPVAYSSSLIPKKWLYLYHLNPMVGVVDGFRWVLLNKAAPPFSMLVFSFIISIVFLISGLFYFQKMESEFADII